MPRAEPPSHLRALTGLRFLAALPVVLFHIIPRAAVGPQIGRMLDFGYLTVGLFFVLSGFVLTYVYGSEETPVNRRAFYQNRFARIYPVYALAMLIALPAYAQLYPSLRLQWWEFPVDVFLRFALIHAWHPGTTQHYNVPSWSLSCEAFFYAIFPFLLPSLQRMKANEVPRSLIAVTVLAAFAPAMYEWTYPGSDAATLGYRVGLIKFHPLVRAAEFIVGMLLAQAYLSRKPQLTPSQSDLMALAAIGTILIAVAIPLPYVLIHTGGLTAAFALMIWALAQDPGQGQGRIAGWLGSPALVGLGEASFALYILHVPVFRIFERAGAQMGLPVTSVPFALAALAVLIALSLAVHRWFEAPLRRCLRAKSPTPAP